MEFSILQYTGGQRPLERLEGPLAGRGVAVGYLAFLFTKYQHILSVSTLCYFLIKTDLASVSILTEWID